MFCRKCGADIPEDSQFCISCGVAVVKPSPISTVPSQNPPVVTPSIGEPPPPIQSIATPDDTKSNSTRKGETLLGIGLIALVFRAVYDLWDFNFLRPVFDPLLWLLAVALYLLYRRLHRRAGKANEPENHEQEKQETSRWARLGIFLGVALTSAILAAFVFVKDSPSAADLTEKLTKTFLTVGLAVWGLSEIVAGRWLTIKRTCIAAVAVYGIAFALVAVFLGKPLAAKMAELDAQQTELDRRYAETATGKTLLQPQSFASAQVAATTLAEFEQYTDVTESVNRRKEALLLERDDPSVRVRWVVYFEATRAAESATKELYRFAAEPSRQVHVENGVVIIADPDGYNILMDAVNKAAGKLRQASAALGEPAPKEAKDQR